MFPNTGSPLTLRQDVHGRVDLCVGIFSLGVKLHLVGHQEQVRKISLAVTPMARYCEKLVTLS